MLAHVIHGVPIILFILPDKRLYSESERERVGVCVCARARACFFPMGRPNNFF